MREQIGGFARKTLVGVAVLVISSAAHCDVGQLQFKGVALGSDRAAVLKAIPMTCKAVKDQHYDESCKPNNVDDQSFAGNPARVIYKFAEKKLDQISIHLSLDDWPDAKASISSKFGLQPSCGRLARYWQCKWNIGPDLIVSTEHSEGVMVEYSWGAGTAARDLRRQKAAAAQNASRMRDL